MAYSKPMKSGSMTSPKGMCSTKDNPLSEPARVSRKCGPGMNKDQQKANKLLQKAHEQWDSQRGKSGM